MIAGGDTANASCANADPLELSQTKQTIAKETNFASVQQEKLTMNEEPDEETPEAQLLELLESEQGMDCTLFLLNEMYTD